MKHTAKYEDIALAQYLAITRKSGLPDELAIETYNDNKDSADRLAKIVVDNTIKNGKDMEKLMTNQTSSAAGDRLKALVERIERLETEKTAIQEDVKEVYKEVAGVGFEPKIVKKMIALRKMEKEKRLEEQELLEMYETAIEGV